MSEFSSRTSRMRTAIVITAVLLAFFVEKELAFNPAIFVHFAFGQREFSEAYSSKVFIACPTARASHSFSLKSTLEDTGRSESFEEKRANSANGVSLIPDVLRPQGTPTVCSVHGASISSANRGLTKMRSNPVGGNGTRK